MDELTRAIAGLDKFTKNWCINREETKAKNDLTFRCYGCEFQTENDTCLIKVFANKHKCKFDMSKFGSMSR